MTDAITPEKREYIGVRPLDLSLLLKHAFISGRESVPGEPDNVVAWVNYTPPEDSAAFKRIISALSALEAAEARLAEALNALGGLLEPFEGDDCRYDHHGDCQAHFLQEGDECCVEIARRVYEGGKVDG